MCDVTARDEAAMFADSSCLPQLYLVAGHTSCAALPDTVSAKQLTEIAAAGHGEVSRDWSAAGHVTTPRVQGEPLTRTSLAAPPLPPEEETHWDVRHNITARSVRQEILQIY